MSGAIAQVRGAGQGRGSGAPRGFEAAPRLRGRFPRGPPLSPAPQSVLSRSGTPSSFGRSRSPASTVSRWVARVSAT